MSFYYPLNTTFGWRSEAAFRDADGNGTLDEANAVDATYYPVPINKPLLTGHSHRMMEWLRSGLSYDPDHLSDGVVAPLQFALSGELWNFSWIRHLCKTVTNAGAEAPYTHTYITTTARPITPPPSLEILQSMAHGSAARHWLYVGCIVSGVQLIASAGSVRATWNLQSARRITGQALSSPMAAVAMRPYPTSNSTTVTLTRGGTAVSGQPRQVLLSYSDGTTLPTDCLGTLYPPYAIHGPRDITCQILWDPTDLDIEDWLADTPASTAVDNDLTLKFSRDTTDDYLEFAFEKIAVESFSYQVGQTLQWSSTFRLKPASFETGAKLTITEKNAWDSTRYS